MEHVKAIFPNQAELAKALGLPYGRVNLWYHRNVVPPHYNGALIRAAAAAGHVLTLEQLEADYASARMG